MAARGVPATGCTERTSFLLRTEEGYDTQSQRVLMIGSARESTLEKDGLLLPGPVTAVLEARQQALSPLVFVGQRELLEGVAFFPGDAEHAGGESVAILEPFIARRQCVLVVHLEFASESDAIPLSCRARLAGPAYVLSVIEVHVRVEFVSRREKHRGVIEIPPAGVRAGVFRTGVVVVVPGHLLAGEVADEAQGLAAIVVLDVVPAVHQLEA